MKKILTYVGTLVVLVLSFFFIRSCTQGESLMDATKNAVESTSGAVTGAIDKTTNAAGSLADGAVNAVDSAAGAAKAVGEGAVDAAKAAGEGAVDAAKAVGEGAADAAKTAGEGAMDAAKTAGEGAMDAAKAVGEGAMENAKGAIDTVKKTTGGMVNATGKMVNAFGEAIGDFFSWSLPGGASINIPKGGFEEKFLSSLKEGGDNKPYIFDRLYFKTGSSNVDVNSNDQIGNVTKILNAYGNVKVLLRGHTDSTGSAVVNKNLSMNRAAAVKKTLISKGILPERISVQGMGAETPVTTNETAEGRSRNRRIDISIIK